MEQQIDFIPIFIQLNTIYKGLLFQKLIKLNPFRIIQILFLSSKYTTYNYFFLIIQ